MTLKCVTLALALCLPGLAQYPPFGPQPNAPPPVAGGVNCQSGSYAALATDTGHLICVNSATPQTLLLPNPIPSPWYFLSVQNIGTGTLTVSPNGLDLDYSAASVALTTAQGLQIYGNGTGYFSMRGLGTGGGGGGGTGAFNMLTVSGTSYFGTLGTQGTIHALDASGTDTPGGSPASATGSWVIDGINVAIGTGATGQATCWKSTIKIGYCSTVVGSGGACTCN
jgi:hypothetical protein